MPEPSACLLLALLVLPQEPPVRSEPAAPEPRAPLVLSGYRLDGDSPAATLAALREDERFPVAEGAAVARGAGLYLVQFVGPVRGAWRAALEATGARVVQAQPRHGYLVQAADGAVERLEDLAARPEVRWVGAFEPGFRLGRDVRAAARRQELEPRPLTVQLLAGPRAGEVEAEVRALATRVRGSSDVGPFRNLYVELPPAAALPLAHDPDVVAVVGRGEPVLLADERLDLIQAGVHDGVGPGPPGYLAWLAEKGFRPEQFADFAVHVVDASLFLDGHPDLPSERIAFQLNPTMQVGSSPHGFFVTNVLAGYNDDPGFPARDGLGYAHGLGVSPFARVGSSAIFGGGEGFDPSAWELQAHRRGARLSNNSFGILFFEYEAFAQLYDFLVRDVDPATPGNQEHVVVAGAGNAGPAPNTLGVPALCKNTIAAGGSESYRPETSTVCAWGAADADEIDDVAAFSSRGPVNRAGGDGRFKPDVLAPATNVQAAVPQREYEGGLCELFHPEGQTLYTWDSGTSFASPAVTGAASLVYQHFENLGRPPASPAMVKALLVNTAAYMDGADAGDTLPSNAQGMGRVDLGRLFDDTPRVLVDQTFLLGEPDEAYRVLGTVADPERPLRVTLAWTDAPGPLTGAPFVNDLDLVVDVEGETYLGNVFEGAGAVPGGTADSRNNVESVFLPAGTSGELLVTVRARDVAGDGVPGNADPSDQDFALVISNAVEGGPYGCETRASLHLLSGEARPGGSLLFGLRPAPRSRPKHAVPLLRLSLAADPAFPCGTPTTGGELLIDPGRELAPPLFGLPEEGSLAPVVRLAIPDDPALVGVSLYAQGALLGDTLALSSGYHVRIGP